MRDKGSELFGLSESILPPSTTLTSNSDVMSLREQEHDLKNKRYQSDTTWRCRLSWWVIIADSTWLLSILVILFCNTKYLQLSDPVLLMLLGTTTINVLGLAFIVLKGLFGNINNFKNKQL